MAVGPDTVVVRRCKVVRLAFHAVALVEQVQQFQVAVVEVAAAAELAVHHETPHDRRETFSR